MIVVDAPRGRGVRSVPPIRPAPAAKTREYRAGLPRKQRPTFDQLVQLIAGPRPGLAWYHDLGRLVRDLLPEGGGRGTGWFKALAEALGPDPSVLHKAARFVELYADKEDFAPLEQQGVNWTRLTLSFSVPDREERHALLDEALSQGWTNVELRAEVERRFPSKRRGVGGRPRKGGRPHGAGPALRELGRQTTRWLEFFDGAWSGVPRPEFRGLVEAEEAGALGRLLKDVGGALARMATACQKAQRTVEDLRQRLKQKGGARKR
jgi:hypothetical protein